MTFDPASLFEDIERVLANVDDVGDEELRRIVVLRQECIDLVVELGSAATNEDDRARSITLARALAAQTDTLLSVARTRRDDTNRRLGELRSSRRATLAYHSGNDERGGRGPHSL